MLIENSSLGRVKPKKMILAASSLSTEDLGVTIKTCLLWTQDNVSA